VTTYTAVIAVDNPKLQLKPGMTATVTATVAEKRDVLVVPNAALRFRPETTPVTAAPAARSGKKGGGPRAGAGSGATLYKVQDNKLQPVRVRLGMTDGISTELISGELAEGDPIAAPALPQGSAPQRQTQTSPFSGGGGSRKGRF
jgi:HlyD family secretion protein